MISEYLAKFGPYLALFLTGGGFAAYIKYRGDKPVSEAEARKKNAEANGTVADEWRTLFKEMKLDNAALIKKIDDLEIKVDQLSEELRKYRVKYGPITE